MPLRIRTIERRDRRIDVVGDWELIRKTRQEIRARGQRVSAFMGRLLEFYHQLPERQKQNILTCGWKNKGHDHKRRRNKNRGCPR